MVGSENTLIDIVLKAENKDSLYKELGFKELSNWPKDNGQKKDNVLRIVYDVPQFEEIPQKLLNKTPKDVLDEAFEQLQSEKKKENSYSRWIARKIALPFIGLAKTVAVGIGSAEILLGAIGSGIGYGAYEAHKAISGDKVAISDYIGPGPGVALMAAGFALNEAATTTKVFPKPEARKKAEKIASLKRS